VRLHLGGQPEDEPPVAGSGKVPRLHRHAHRVAGEGQHHVRSDRDPSRCNGGDGEREGRVAGDLRRPDPSGAELLEPASDITRRLQAGVELHVHEHGGTLTTPHGLDSPDVNRESRVIIRDGVRCHLPAFRGALLACGLSDMRRPVMTERCANASPWVGFLRRRRVNRSARSAGARPRTSRSVSAWHDVPKIFLPVRVVVANPDEDCSPEAFRLGA